MAREQEFIEKLSNFTTALEELVNLLKEQNKTSPTENLNNFLENFDAEIITSITKNLQEVKDKTIEINKNTEKILKAINDQKKQKESGMFGEISDNKNKNKIVDGVKTVILIAAGVLAIGMAFKIIGKVDFLSVVALGLGIMFVANAFSKVAVLKDDKGKPLGWKQIVMGALTLIIISGAILASGLILKQIPVLDIAELLTVVLIGVSLGLATFFILKGINNLSFKDIAKASLVPVILPAVALGIVGAGFALTLMPEVTFKQALSAFMVSIAMLPIMLGIGYMVKGLSNASIDDIMLVGLAIPIMAGGIYLASIILQNVKPIPFFDVILAGIAIGIVVLAMTPTIYVLSKAGLTDPKKLLELTIGVAAIALISLAIVASSWILSLGNYEEYPSAGWVLGAGLSIILFTLPVAVVGLMAMTGVGLVALGLGIISIPLIATAIMLTSWILSVGDYSTFPSYEWSLSVGLSLLTFGIPMVALGTLIVASFGIGLGILAAGIGGIILIAEAIVEADKILSKGKWGTYPSPDWSLGVGLAIRAFSEVLIELVKLQMLSSMVSFFFGGEIEIDLPSFIRNVSDALLEAAKMFNSAPNVFGGNYPTEDWAKGVGMSIRAFSEVLIELTKLQMLKDMLSFFSLGIIGGGEIDLPAFIEKTVAGIIAAGKAFSEVEGDIFKGKYPNEEWAKGVGGSVKSFAEAISAMDSAGVDIDYSDLESDDGMISVMKGLAKGLIEVAKVFNENKVVEFDTNKIPKEEWGKGIGAALSAFANAAKDLKDSGLEINTKDLFKEDGAVAVMVGLSIGIIAVGRLFENSKVSFDLAFVPSTEWSEALSSAINAFTSINVEGFDYFKIIPVVSSMLLISSYFSKMNSLTLPTTDWINSFFDLIRLGVFEMISVGIILSATDFSSLQAIIEVAKIMYNYSAWISRIQNDFGDVFETEGFSSKIAKSIDDLISVIPTQDRINPLWSFISALNNLSSVPWYKMIKIYEVADAIGYLSEQLSDIDAESTDAISKLSAGLHVMALVDEERLYTVLKAIEDKSDVLSSVMNEGGFINKLFSDVSNIISGQNTTVADGSTSATQTSTVQTTATQSKPFEEELLEYIKNIDENVAKLAEASDREREEKEKLEAKNVEGEGKK